MIMKREYTAIAKILDNERPWPEGPDWGADRDQAISDVTHSLAKYFEEGDPHFNWNKFLEEAGIEQKG